MSSDEDRKFTAKALYDFEPQGPDEIPLTAGEIVTVLSETDDWSNIKRRKNGQEGFVPSNWLEEIDDPVPVKKAPPPRRGPPPKTNNNAPSWANKNKAATKPWQKKNKGGRVAAMARGYNQNDAESDDEVVVLNSDNNTSPWGESPATPRDQLPPPPPGNVANRWNPGGGKNNNSSAQNNWRGNLKPVKGKKKKKKSNNAPSLRRTINNGRQNLNVDSDMTYTLLAASMEWWACLALFFSGMFSLLWGSQESPENIMKEVFGAAQSASAGILLVYFGTCRECCCMGEAQEKTALLRAFVMLAISVLGFLAYPLGAIGGGAMALAAFANLYAYMKNAKPLHDDGASLGWVSMGLNFSEVLGSSLGTAMYLLVIIGGNVLFYWLGMQLGQRRINKEFDENRFRLGSVNEYGFAEMWQEPFAHAEGFGAVIAINVAFIFLSATRGIHEYFLEWANLRQGEPGCSGYCSNCLSWLFDGQIQLLFHKTFACVMIFATIGHCAMNFRAYEQSGPGRDFFTIFGTSTMATGVLLILFLIPIYSAANPKIVENNESMFITVHLCWVAVTILLFLHGPANPIPWSSNFWMFMALPGVLFILDMVFKRGYGLGHDQKE